MKDEENFSRNSAIFDMTYGKFSDLFREACESEDCISLYVDRCITERGETYNIRYEKSFILTMECTPETKFSDNCMSKEILI